MSSEIDEERLRMTMEERRKKEPQMKKESGLKAFIISMVAIVIIAAALTSGTYNGYDPNPHSVALTGFFVIVTIIMTAVWYRTKYNDYSFEGNKDREN
ncbi:hypothetical protein [Thermoplasma sp.]|uniref:hypothetical protein n=1 Tax=Thermoplasma sp. TaxID=1973142 RepID=UPI0026257AEA|nr:hypothetical protein [Thermoplasma sp.]